MALEDILKKIAEDTDSQIEKLREEYEEEKKKRLDEFEDFKNHFLQRAEKEAEEKARLHKERLISRAQADANLEILKKKQQLLSEVYDNAREKISNLGDKEKAELFAVIFADIGIAKGKLHIAKTFPQKEFMAALEKKMDKKPELDIVENGDIDMGFVLETGNIRYDNTVGSLLEQAREQLQDKLVGILFKEQSQNSKS